VHSTPSSIHLGIWVLCIEFHILAHMFRIQMMDQLGTRKCMQKAILLDNQLELGSVLAELELVALVWAALVWAALVSAELVSVQKMSLKSHPDRRHMHQRNSSTNIVHCLVQM
jgi:hypothetical protein